MGGNKKGDENIPPPGRHGGCTVAESFRLLLGGQKAISSASLHPDVAEIGRALLRSEESVKEHIGHGKHRFKTAYTHVKRDDENLHFQLTLSFDGNEFFTGAVTLLGASKFGPVTVALAAVATVELVYLQAVQLSARNLMDVTINIGILTVTGICNQSVVKTNVAPLFAKAASTRGANKPGLGVKVFYGLFPTVDFRHFYGAGYILNDI